MKRKFGDLQLSDKRLYHEPRHLSIAARAEQAALDESAFFDRDFVKNLISAAAKRFEMKRSEVQETLRRHIVYKKEG